MYFLKLYSLSHHLSFDIFISLGGSVAEGVRWGGGVGGAGVRVDVNAMLGVGGDVGYGGCEPRIEGIVQCTKRYCTILRK